MINSRDNSGRVVRQEWHEFRKQARKTAFSPEEFSDRERERYNLDDDDELSAGITGEDNPETYVGDDTGPTQSGGTAEERDLRNLPGRA